jgi:hypothetical protein
LGEKRFRSEKDFNNIICHEYYIRKLLSPNGVPGYKNRLAPGTGLNVPDLTIARIPTALSEHWPNRNSDLHGKSNATGGRNGGASAL